MLQRDARDVGHDAAIDGDVALVVGDEVLVLRPSVADDRAHDEDREDRADGQATPDPSPAARRPGGVAQLFGVDGHEFFGGACVTGLVAGARTRPTGGGADELRLAVRRRQVGVGLLARVDELADDHGDVVVPAALECEPDELGGRHVDRLRAERPLDLRVVDHVGEAVAAQQVAVAQLALDVVEVGLVVVTAEQHPQQQRAVRMPTGLGRGELALVDQALHERVVAADLGEDSVTQPVGTRVADVGGREPLAVPQHRLQRGAHALDGGVGRHQVAEVVVGGAHRFLEGGERVDVVELAVELTDDVHRLGGGEVTRSGAAHAVGHGDQPAAGVPGVLVVGAAQTGVGQGDVPEPQGSHQHSITSAARRWSCRGGPGCPGPPAPGW